MSDSDKNAPTPRTDAEIARTARIGAMSGMEQAWQDMCHHALELECELAEDQHFRLAVLAELDPPHPIAAQQDKPMECDTSLKAPAVAVPSSELNNASAPGERKPGEIAAVSNDASGNRSGSNPRTDDGRSSQEQAQPAGGAQLNTAAPLGDPLGTAPSPGTVPLATPADAAVSHDPTPGEMSRALKAKAERIPLSGISHEQPSDTERLNWIERKGIALGRLICTYENGADVVPPRILGWWVGELSEVHPTLREAIDDAMGTSISASATGTTDIPEGHRSPPAGALESGSPIHVARDANPGGAAPGGVEPKSWMVAFSGGKVKIAQGDQWSDPRGCCWRVEECSGTSYSPSNLGGGLDFWCSLVSGTLPAAWENYKDSHGWVEFNGDSIACAIARNDGKDA